MPPDLDYDVHQRCSHTRSGPELAADVELQVPLYPESNVQVKLDSTEASEWQGDLLAVGLYEDDISSEGMALRHVLASALSSAAPDEAILLKITAYTAFAAFSPSLEALKSFCIPIGDQCCVSK